MTTGIEVANWASATEEELATATLEKIARIEHAEAIKLSETMRRSSRAACIQFLTSSDVRAHSTCFDNAVSAARYLQNEGKK
jgi:hypothetical protein